jgi:cystathionine gamma-synthase
MDRHNQNGQAVAEWLENDPRIRQVWYPGLKSHPDHATATRQMRGFGGVVTFEIETDLNGAMRFIDATQVPYQAPSLGGVESLIELPVTMSFWDIPKSERLQLGITDSLVRYACGIENADDIIADVDQALTKV